MTEHVLVSIKGLQILQDAEAEDAIELITAGNYYNRNGHHFIKYEEIMEGFEGVTNNLIKVKPDAVEVRKKGVANVHMIFEENKKNVTFYHTPFGSMKMGVSATKVSVKETEQNIDITVDYALDINEEHVADCSIILNIKSKNATDFSLERKS